MPKYQVVVGNIGTVVDTDDFGEAKNVFADYEQKSLTGSGRAAGQEVTLFEDGEIHTILNYGSEHGMTTTLTTKERAQRVLDQSRNGCNSYFGHPLVPKFIYTEGVRELAQAASCFWLLDLLAIPLLKAVKEDPNANNGSMVILTLTKYSQDAKATLEASSADDAPPFWTYDVDWTDFPLDSLTLYAQWDGDVLITILPSEY